MARKRIFIDEDGNEITEAEAALAQIDAAELVRRLQDAALGTVLMVPTAIAAATALLDRLIPRLAAPQRVNLTDADGTPLSVQIVQFSKPSEPSTNVVPLRH
jgi:hypothetical protein